MNRRRFLTIVSAIPAVSIAPRVLGQACAPSADCSGLDPSVVCTGFPCYNIKASFGAVGDGVTNDTTAFQDAATALMCAGGGTLIIPPATYVVGRQTINPSGPYYDAEDIFSVKGLACLIINGHGATLKIENGLHYGGFDTNGIPVDVTTRDQTRAAHVGRIIEAQECNNVWIRGLELDGNSQALVLGGQWGDVDRQTNATGIWLNRCPKARVTNVHTHHHALDGIAVLHLGAPPPVEMPHTLIRVVSEYNGRQGLSWIGGHGLECRDCKFSHSGRAINQGGGNGHGDPLASAPSAGLDIEPNSNTLTRKGRFLTCEFVDNAGNGVEASNGDSDDNRFEDCIIWGTTNYSFWLNRPGITFENCEIYGTAALRGNPALGTTFGSCNFEDKDWAGGEPGKQCFRLNSLIAAQLGGAGVVFDRCTFTAHQVRSVNMACPDVEETFNNCTFVHGFAMSSSTFQCTIQGSRLAGCRFKEADLPADRTYYIRLYNASIVDSADGSQTVVEGPRVKWRTTAAPPPPPNPPWTIPTGVYSSNWSGSCE